MPARTLTDAQFERLCANVQRAERDPYRALCAIFLSFKAGLRAAEIAGLCWKDVTDVEGQITNAIVVPNSIAKKGHGRTIPMHGDLRERLVLLKDNSHRHDTLPKCPIIKGPVSPRMSPNNMQKYLAAIYSRAGLYGVSSHSGRRTLLTKLARMANSHDCSLYDVQKIAGHSDISTTERYVELSDGVGDLINGA